VASIFIMPEVLPEVEVVEPPVESPLLVLVVVDPLLALVVVDPVVVLDGAGSASSLGFRSLIPVIWAQPHRETMHSALSERTLLLFMAFP
jgi:hypothetical protein